MSQTLSYKNVRDLLTGMSYKRGNTGVASRTYTYDAAGRPITRNTARNGITVNDSFGYNNRSELTSATVNGSNYAYDYDNIGNRETATESEITTTYTANELNQYTAVGDFTPTFDADGNQTLVKTSAGIWSITYDAENRPVSFTNAETNTVIECAYDHMGRRATKKVTVNGVVTLHHRYLYRGFLQIACCDLTRSNHPALWLITWDPTQPIATRPLAIQKDGTWYTYGWDLTKNICEVYGINGYIRTNYTYTPYGAVTISGDVTQPIQWSSEFHDDELALVYYNYRHYNPTDGRWLGRDLALKISKNNLYCYIFNKPWHIDYIGLADVLYFGKRLGIKSTRYNQPVSAALIEEMIKELLEDMKATKYAPDIIDAGVNLFFPSLMHSGVQYIAVIVYKCECKKKCLFGLFINKEIELPSWQMTIKPSDYKNDANVRGGFGTMHPAPTEKELTEFIMKRSEATTKRNEYKCKKGCKEA